MKRINEFENKKILKSLEQITKVILKEENYNNDLNISLLSGISGNVLLLVYYYFFSNKKDYGQKAIVLLDHILANISKIKGYSLSGLTGVFWLLQHLVNVEFIDEEEVLNLIEIDEIIYESFKQDELNHDYDLLHGLIGKGLYFVERHKNTNSTKELNSLLNILENMSVQTQYNTTTWKFPSHYNKRFPEAKGIKYSLGLSHGIPSILCFLFTLHELKIQNKKVEYLIKNNIKWLLNFEMENSISCFPAVIREPKNSLKESPLAWCYGDLGVSLSFFRASKILKKDDYYQKGLMIARHSLKRNLASSFVRMDSKKNIIDACLCHGTSGIALMYNRIYKLTKLQEFRQKSQYWGKLTVDAQKKDNGLAGYFSHNIFVKNSNINTSYGLLDGIAGIGLCLLSIYNPSEDFDWEKVLLLK